MVRLMKYSFSYCVGVNRKSQQLLAQVSNAAKIKDLNTPIMPVNPTFQYSQPFIEKKYKDFLH